MPQYVTFEKTENKLIIRLIESERDQIDEDKMDIFDVCEHQCCNGWMSIPPEQIGALTDAPIFSDDFELADDVGEFLFKRVGVIYYYADYQIRNPVTVLLEQGYVAFTKHV